VEVVGALPEAGAEVFVDDLALVAGGAAGAPVASVGDRNLLMCGSTVRIEGPGGEPTLLGVLPVVASDPLLQELDALGLLCPSDVGLELAVETGDAHFRLAWEGADRLVVELPPAAAGVATLGEADARWSDREPQFEDGAVRAVLCGTALGRAVLRFPEPVEVRGRLGRDAYRLEVRSEEHTSE